MKVYVSLTKGTGYLSRVSLSKKHIVPGCDVTEWPMMVLDAANELTKKISPDLPYYSYKHITAASECLAKYVHQKKKRDLILTIAHLFIYDPGILHEMFELMYEQPPSTTTSGTSVSDRNRDES